MVKAKVAFISTIPTPYRRPMLERLLKIHDLDLKIYYCNSGTSQRPWKLDISQFRKTTFLQGWSIRLGKRFLHINPGILSELQKKKFDVVVINGYSHPTTMAATIWCQITRTPYILMCETHAHNPRYKFKQKVKSALLDPLISKAGAHLAIGSYASEYLISHGAHPNGVFIFPNTPDIEYFDKKSTSYRKQRDQLRSKIGIHPKSSVVLFVGRLVQVKGVDVLLKAFNKVQFHYPHIECLIVGDGPIRSTLEKMCKKKQIRNVHFVGFRQPDELPPYYALSDLFVLPSRVEPWGVVVNEAMACHLPVVLSDRVGAAGDLVKSGQTGFVVPVESPAELATVIRLFVSNPQAAKNMGEKARQIVEDWNYERGVQGFLKAVHYATQGKTNNTMT